MEQEIKECAEEIGTMPIPFKDADHVVGLLEEAKHLLERANWRHKVMADEGMFPEEYKELQFAIYVILQKRRMRIL